MSIFNMVGCGGGSSLNYEVVGGTSAPSSPSVNTIWINTSTTITSHIFSATQPTNPASGMVWITVGASSAVAFSATEENPVMVYPISAKQYVGGAWVDVTAKSYQGGEWGDWWNELYDAGNQFESITGGWKCNSALNWMGMTVNGSIEYGKYLTVKANSNTCYNATTVNKINLTEYSQLLYDIASDSSTDDAIVLIHESTSGQLQQIKIASSNNGVLNLSGISGSYYITVTAANNRTIKVGNIRLVR